MKTTTPIKDFYNRILGYIETDDVTGDKTALDFYRRVLGHYYKNRNVTTDFYNRVIANGDAAVSLIYTAEKK